MTALKLTRLGTSTGVIIPKEMLARLKVEKGDTLYAIETAEGYLLTPYDPTTDKQLKVGRQFMKNNRDTFKALAKWLRNPVGSAEGPTLLHEESLAEFGGAHGLLQAFGLTPES